MKSSPKSSKNELLDSINLMISENNSARLRSLPLDYFSWGRDQRHQTDDTEQLPLIPGVGRVGRGLKRMLKAVLTWRRPRNVDDMFASFNDAYLLMSDSYSRNLFTELLVMMMLGEKKFRLSSFDDAFVSAYEESSEEILNSPESLDVYTWVLKKVRSERPAFSVFTTPVFLALLRQQRLYSYARGEVSVDACEGDTVIEGGIGWGDTTMYLASKVSNSGRVYSFDVLDEGIDALRDQLEINPQVENVTPVLNALSDVDGETVYITSPSPGARISKASTNRSVKTISIDNYVETQRLLSVDFIKMDIEGAEIPALTGARNTIKKFKPKLAISAYHKWDDLREIPRLIHGIRSDYEFYLDCTTGFGGEAVLYCR